MKTYLIMLLILLFSCTRINEQVIDKSISEPPFLDAAKYYYIRNLTKWRLDASFVENNTSVFGDTTDDYYTGGFYYFKKREKDTLYLLGFEYYSSKHDTIFIPKEFYKRYENDAFQHVILFGENGDTLFHYKADLFGSLKKVFISGKYYYQVLFFEINSKQLKYFEKHKDSLIRVKGNNLPELPEYNDP